jgi:hypothetical protein
LTSNPIPQPHEIGKLLASLARENLELAERQVGFPIGSRWPARRF